MADSSAKLGPALPKGDGNGLAAIAADLIADPRKVRVGLILFDAGEIATKTDTGERVAKARIRRVEVIRDQADAAVMQRILMREFERRTGQTTLPMELEQDVEDAFADFEQEQEGEG